MPTIKVDGVSINYIDTGGNGIPLVFVHGFPLSSRMWSSQFEAFSPRRMVAPDLMGFGDSDAPADPTLYSIDTYARQVVAVIEATGAPKVVLCGLSLGGYVLFGVLRAAPEYAAAVVLADTRAEADTSETVEKRTRQQAEVRAGGTKGLIDASSASLPSRATSERKPEVIAELKTIMDNPAAGIIGALEAMKQRPDSTPILASITVPTLVIVGEEDSVTPVETARALAESIPNAELVVVPDAGHLTNIEQPAAFNRALSTFLDSL